MRIIFALIIPILLLGSVVYYINLKGSQTETIKIKLGNRVVEAELADSHLERTQGLMFRESLGEDEGMWFIFDEEGYLSFWMKNTFIPLDIIWINETMEIIHIEKNLPPCGDGPCLSYKPTAKAKYVLEVNAGWVDKSGIEVGQKVEIL